MGFSITRQFTVGGCKIIRTAVAKGMATALGSIRQEISSPSISVSRNTHRIKRILRDRLRLLPEPGNIAGSLVVRRFVVHANEFRPLAEGTFVNYVTFQGHYQLP